MKYTILTLGNPEREHYRQSIREAMRRYEEAFIECVDGKNEIQLNSHIDKYGFDINMPEWRPGEGGVWYSTINAWQYAVDNDCELVVFEDDAIINNGFTEAMKNAVIPATYDFATYYIPYRRYFQVNYFRFHRVAQEHGNVCVRYSPQGASKILSLLEAEGLEWPVDIWLYKKAMAGALEGYGPKETSRVIVDVDLEVPTNIHNDDRIKVYKGEK